MLWKDQKRTIIIFSCILILLSALPMAQSGVRGLLINDLVGGVGTGTFSSQLIALIALFAFVELLFPIVSSYEFYFQRKLWFFLSERFEVGIIQKRGEIDVASHEDPKQNDLFNKIDENGTWRVQNFAERQFYLIQNVLQVMFASVVLILFSGWVFLALLACTLPALFIEMRYGKQIWDIHSSRAEVRRKFWELRSHFYNVSGISELKLFGNVKYFMKIIRDLFVSFRNEEFAADRRILWERLLSLVLSHIAITGIAIFFIWRVIKGDLQIGTLTFALAAVADFRESLSSFFHNLGSQSQDSLFVTDVFKFLNIRPFIARPLAGTLIPSGAPVRIEFCNVSFAYPGTDRMVLKDLSLVIESGQKVAFVGVNGAGKTTFIKLLCRFYDPTEGKILINGTDLRQIDLDSWYRQMGVLFQNFQDYRMPVKEVIAIGDSSVPLDENRVRAAAEQSEADAFIAQWEKGYDQMLGKGFSGGVDPSGGQWQKLALARVFYRNAPIFILDEPTSAIDAQAEAQIFERLEQMSKEKTLIFISHRFSTVRHADKIFVVENGSVIEQGSHEELVRRKGMYEKLFKLQAKGYE